MMSMSGFQGLVVIHGPRAKPMMRQTLKRTFLVGILLLAPDRVLGAADLPPDFAKTGGRSWKNIASAVTAGKSRRRICRWNNTAMRPEWRSSARSGKTCGR